MSEAFIRYPSMSTGLVANSRTILESDLKLLDYSRLISRGWTEQLPKFLNCRSLSETETVEDESSNSCVSATRPRRTSTDGTSLKPDHHIQQVLHIRQSHSNRLRNDHSRHYCPDGLGINNNYRSQ